MIQRLLILALTGSLSLPSCATGAKKVGAPATPRQAPDSILFIGNSLTGWNDLAGMVCAMAAQTGRNLVCDSVVIGGASLEDHRHRGLAAQRLGERQWSIVALQQGPSALPESRIALRASAAEYAKLIRHSGATPALYAVWPSASRSLDFPAVAESYRLAARDTGALLFPAGTAWMLAWKQDGSLPLYAEDRFHPSPEGTYLAALVIYRQLFGDLPAALSTPSVANASAGTELRLDEEQLRVLREAAEAATAESERR